MQNDSSSQNQTESPKKIVEPLLTIPKPRSQIFVKQQQQQQQPNHRTHQSPIKSNGIPNKTVQAMSKYAELLHVIGELGQHIRPSYTGHRGSAEKIRQGIIKARGLVRECLIETEKSARQ